MCPVTWGRGNYGRRRRAIAVRARMDHVQPRPAMRCTSLLVWLWQLLGRLHRDMATKEHPNRNHTVRGFLLESCPRWVGRPEISVLPYGLVEPDSVRTWNRTWSVHAQANLLLLTFMAGAGGPLPLESVDPCPSVSFMDRELVEQGRRAIDKHTYYSHNSATEKDVPGRIPTDHRPAKSWTKEAEKEFCPWLRSFLHCYQINFYWIFRC